MSQLPVRKREMKGAREGYDRWAPSYDGLDNPLVAMARGAMAEWESGDGLAGARVLEVGCGTGRNAPFFLARGAAGYVGVDGSEGMLAHARARGLPRCEWVHADFAGPWPAGMAEVDVVLFWLVLEHAPQLHAALAQAARALRTGGELRAYELHAELRATGVQAHFRDGDTEIALPSFAHDAAEYREALGAAGLTVARIDDRRASASDVAASAKLAKYVGRRVLVQVIARK